MKYSKQIGKIYNIHSKEEAHGVAELVHNTLAKHLAGKSYFFSEESKENLKVVLSFADIVVYAFLKEELELMTDSPAAESLKLSPQYATLRSFVQSFEDAVQKDSFTGSFIALSTRELSKIAEKYVSASCISSPYASLSLTQVETEEAKQTAKIRKITIAATVSAFVTFMNIS